MSASVPRRAAFSRGTRPSLMSGAASGSVAGGANMPELSNKSRCDRSVTSSILESAEEDGRACVCVCLSVLWWWGPCVVWRRTAGRSNHNAQESPGDGCINLTRLLGLPRGKTRPRPSSAVPCDSWRRRQRRKKERKRGRGGGEAAPPHGKSNTWREEKGWGRVRGEEVKGRFLRFPIRTWGGTHRAVLPFQLTPRVTFANTCVLPARWCEVT